MALCVLCTKLGKDNIVINKKKLIELLLPFHGKMKNFDFTKKSNVFLIHKSFHFEKYFVKSICIDLCFFMGKKLLSSPFVKSFFEELLSTLHSVEKREILSH